MPRTFIAETIGRVGEKVRVCGWVQTIREHGRVIFIDLRDWTGLVQVVFPATFIDLETVKRLSIESSIAIVGRIQARPPDMTNDQMATGGLEIAAETLEVFSRAENIPFDVKSDGRELDEEKRLKYRYLDLRRDRLKKNLIRRHQIINFIRRFLAQEGFIEIETPILTKSTPEGARDYIVPSRLQPGRFYALPQSPQQYKQLLQVGGLERYFQIAKCFHDEDQRADRQPEFTQLDLEMAFVEREDVMDLNERLIIGIIENLFPEKKIQAVPFPRLSYQEVMKEHGTDRPDLRKDKTDDNLLSFVWVIDFPFFEKDQEDHWTFTHNPFSAAQAESHQRLMDKENISEILTTQYDIVLNGSEIGGGSIRNHQAQALKRVFEIMGYAEERIQTSFGHMLRAFSFGCPPHGGIAWGLDRFVTILSNEESIREVMAFPKTGDGRDLMMEVPSTVSSEQLEELGIKVVVKKDKRGER